MIKSTAPPPYCAVSTCVCVCVWGLSFVFFADPGEAPAHQVWAAPGRRVCSAAGRRGRLGAGSPQPACQAAGRQGASQPPVDALRKKLCYQAVVA